MVLKTGMAGTAVAGAIALMCAMPAGAAGPTYKAGKYAGRVRTQGKIKFVVTGHRLTAFATSGRVTCNYMGEPDGVAGYQAKLPARKSIAIKRNGRFSYNFSTDGGNYGYKITGKLKGSSASGTFADFNDSQEPYTDYYNICDTGTLQFTAKTKS